MDAQLKLSTLVSWIRRGAGLDVASFAKRLDVSPGQQLLAELGAYDRGNPQLAQGLIRYALDRIFPAHASAHRKDGAEHCPSATTW